MKDVLNHYKVEYEAIDINNNINAKVFLSEYGHKTVPQLYVNDIHVNKKNTLDYTPSELYGVIRDVLDYQEWKGIDSGIEQEF